MSSYLSLPLVLSLMTAMTGAERHPLLSNAQTNTADCKVRKLPLARANGVVQIVAHAQVM